MAIMSIGYPGQIQSAQWASIGEELGQAYGVRDKDDWKVSVGAGDRTVSIAPGVAYGRGVQDTNTDDYLLGPLPSVGSGSRYDLICARRTWGVTNQTTITSIPGTAVANIPAGRNANPGTLDDQPLALVKITAGSTVPVIEADLRTWPSKVVTVKDLRAVVDQRLGDETVLSTTGVRYRWVLDNLGNPVLRDASPEWKSYTPQWPGNHGTGTFVGRYCIEGKRMHLNIFLAPAPPWYGGPGNSGSWWFTLPPGVVAATWGEQLAFTKMYWVISGHNITGFGYISPGGTTINLMAPYVNAGATPNQTWLRVDGARGVAWDGSSASFNMTLTTTLEIQ